MSKPEWFKLNPTKFLQDSLIDSLTTEELGCCLRLMCRQWTDGYIPDDIGKLARLCRTDATRMGDLWVTLCDFFPVIEEGKRANRFMFVEREIVQTEMDKRSTDGRKAAEKRWNQAVNNSDATPNGSPMPHPMQEKNKKESKTEKKKKSNRAMPDELAPRLEALCTSWPGTFVKEGQTFRLPKLSNANDLWDRLIKFFPNDDPEEMIMAGEKHIQPKQNDDWSFNAAKKQGFTIAMTNFYGQQARWKEFR